MEADDLSKAMNGGQDRNNGVKISDDETPMARQYDIYIKAGNVYAPALDVQTKPGAGQLRVSTRKAADGRRTVCADQAQDRHAAAIQEQRDGKHFG